MLAGLILLVGSARGGFECIQEPSIYGGDVLLLASDDCEADAAALWAAFGGTRGDPNGLVALECLNGVRSIEYHLREYRFLGGKSTLLPPDAGEDILRQRRCGTPTTRSTPCWASSWPRARSTRAVA